eukprot:157925-Amphidinium_carterae.3
METKRLSLVELTRVIDLSDIPVVFLNHLSVNMDALMDMTVTVIMPMFIVLTIVQLPPLFVKTLAGPWMMKPLSTNMAMPVWLMDFGIFLKHAD